MSNQIYIPPINFNENENLNSSSVTSINAIEPLEYNKLNSNLSIKAATENNYGVITTGDQNIKGNKNFINGIISEDANFINLELNNGTITSEPTNNTDIVNKGYVDDKTADMAKYDVSTNYLVSNKTNSNISELKTDSLNVSSNYINKEPNTVLVRTRGGAGTFDKYITIYKSILNGKISIIFDKNLDFNTYANNTDASISKNSIILNLSDMSDISKIYKYLPNEFELTGEVSTYGGTRNIATKTLKFKKSPSDLYKYDIQYDQSFPFNIFKLKESIKNIDTVISSTEIQKINTLTIEKGYLYDTPTEDNNLVNKSYVDTIADKINNVKSELNTSIENSKSELNNNISTKISQISEVSLSRGTLENVQNLNNSLINKNYVDGQINKAKNELNNTINSTKSEINSYIDSSINNAKTELNQNITDALNNLQIENVNLTTGTISTDPANDTDITNKKYIDNVKTEINGNITTAINNIKTVNLTTGTISTDPTNNTDITNKLYVDTSINSFKSYSDSNFIKYDSGSSKLIKSSSDAVQQITNLNLSDLQITNKITIDKNVMDLQNFGMCPIENSSGSVLRLCAIYFLKVKVNNTIYLSIRLSFEPFVSSGGTLYIKNVELSDIGTSYQDYITYYCIVNSLFKFGRCTFIVTKNSEGKYDIEISGTANGDNIYKFDAFNVVYYLN